MMQKPSLTIIGCIILLSAFFVVSPKFKDDMTDYVGSDNIRSPRTQNDANNSDVPSSGNKDAQNEQTTSGQSSVALATS